MFPSSPNKLLPYTNYKDTLTAFFMTLLFIKNPTSLYDFVLKPSQLKQWRSFGAKINVAQSQCILFIHLNTRSYIEFFVSRLFVELAISTIQGFQHENWTRYRSGTSLHSTIDTNNLKRKSVYDLHDIKSRGNQCLSTFMVRIIIFLFMNQLLKTGHSSAMKQWLYNNQIINTSLETCSIAVSAWNSFWALQVQKFKRTNSSSEWNGALYREIHVYKLNLYCFKIDTNKYLSVRD